MTSLLDARLDGLPPTLECVPRSRPVDRELVDEIRQVLEWAGLELDAWQESLLLASLGVRDDGLWAAFEVAGVVPRQNGKGAVMEARQLVGLFVLGERLQIHTAHEFKTCVEHFLRVKALVESSDELFQQVRIIRTGAGDQSIELHTGERLRFVARSRSSIRGFSCDALYFDEAFELPTATVGSALPALSARPNPQVWYFSSAPHADSEFLHALLNRAENGDVTGRLLLRAWENPDSVDPHDVEAVARVNPAYGFRIDEAFVVAERDTLCATPAGVVEYKRERLGVREAPLSAFGPIDLAVWAACADDASQADAEHSWALSVSPDRKWACIGVAGRRADGLLHVGYLAHEPGTAWVVAAAVERFRKRKIPLRVATGSAEASLIGDLREAGVTVDEVATSEVARSTGEFIDAVNNLQVRHRGDRSLTKSLEHAELKTTEAGASVWAERSSEVELSPLKAATVALGGVCRPARKPRIHVYDPNWAKGGAAT